MRKRLILVIIVGVGVLLASVSMKKYPPILIYNPSQSALIGFYIIDQKTTPKVGSYILVEIPYSVRDMAIARGYVGSNIPLLKKVFATSGDHVCSRSGRVFVNEKLITKVRNYDPSGRKLPIWTGCRVLKKGEYFLLSLYSEYSFDSRYFGPIMQDQIIGVATYL